MTKRLILWVAALVLFISGVLPVLSMFHSSLLLGGHFSFSNYLHIFSSEREWILLKNSLTLALLVSLITLFLGVPLGLLLGKTDIPFKRQLSLILCIPILIPPYIMAVSVDNCLGQEGILRPFLPGWVLRSLSDHYLGLGGSVFVLSTVYLPIPMLLTICLLKNVNPSLEEAARLCAKWPLVLKEITLPIIRPGLTLSALLVFVLCLGEFSVPSYLRYQVFSVESFTQFSAVYDFGSATAQSMPLAVIALLLLVAESRYSRKSLFLSTPLVSGTKTLEIALGRSRPYLFILVSCLAFLIVIVPLLSLFYSSLDLFIYEEAIKVAGDALLRSFFYAFLGASLLAVLGFLSAYTIKNRQIWCWRLVDMTSLFLFAIPGTVLGIGLIATWNNSWTQFVYSSLLIIVLGYLARYHVLSSRIILSQLYLISPSMEEAAQLAGAGWLSRMLFILAPLSKRAIMAAWLCVFLFCLRDTDISLIVYPPGCETLPVRIFTLMANGSPGLISSLCMLMVVSVLVPASILWHLRWRR